jgi:MinD superfamily P-loop ATPase
MLACPENAICEMPREIGVVESGCAGPIEFVQGRLNIGEPMATPIIKKVKSHINNQRLTIIDASPGTACPVVEAIKNCDFCLLVTEPTPFGLSDLRLAVEVTEKLGLPCGVVINRSGEGDEKTEAYLREKTLPLLGRIPFQRAAAEAYARGIHPAQALPEFRQRLETIRDRVMHCAAAGMK